jgi:hypothetical protein
LKAREDYCAGIILSTEVCEAAGDSSYAALEARTVGGRLTRRLALPVIEPPSIYAALAMRPRFLRVLKINAKPPLKNVNKIPKINPNAAPPAPPVLKKATAYTIVTKMFHNVMSA